MAAQCYWCHTNDEELKDPLGTCSDCWVFACDTHAELDTANLGKWKCFDGVAKLASAGAGFDEVDEAAGLAISSTEELEQRFPRIASATAAEREEWRARMSETLPVARQIDPDRAAWLSEGHRERLLADAIGILRHFVAPQRTFAGRLTEPPSGASNLHRLVQALE
jgi:hypothetical protein